jgi:Raf kinase inhibitor-like YbhB/YbcL family protein
MLLPLIVVLVLLLVFPFIFKTWKKKSKPKSSAEPEGPGKLEITSPAFEHESMMPLRYTGLAEEFSPPLEIRNTPPEAQTLALIADDPDAPMMTVTHWILWNIPPDTISIPEGIPEGRTAEVLGGASQGINIARKHAYIGPRPPFGTHRYRFKVYALNTKLDLRPNSGKKQLENAMKGHIIQQALLVGLFNRNEAKR